MGDVLEFLEMKESVKKKEEHRTTEEFINDLTWYIREMNKLQKDYSEKLNGINTVFTVTMRKYKGREEDE